MHYASYKYATVQYLNHWKYAIGIGFFIFLCKSSIMQVSDMQPDRFDCTTTNKNNQILKWTTNKHTRIHTKPDYITGQHM